MRSQVLPIGGRTPHRSTNRADVGLGSRPGGSGATTQPERAARGASACSANAQENVFNSSLAITTRWIWFVPS